MTATLAPQPMKNLSSPSTSTGSVAAVINEMTDGASRAFLTIQYPAFGLLASDQAGRCDVFGPLCQTGSVTVPVDLTSSTITSVVPCSTYLSAQAQSVLHGSNAFYNQEIYQQGTVSNTAVNHWLSSFGRSPQCSMACPIYNRRVYSDVI